MKFLRQFSRITVINLLVIFILLSAFEVYLYFDDYYEESNTYLYETEKFQYQFLTPPTKKSNIKNMYFLGDSFTMGYKCKYENKDFPSIIQEVVNNNINVINLGSGGLNTSHYNDLIQHYDFGEVDKLFIVLYFNDIFLTEQICDVIKSNNKIDNDVNVPNNCLNLNSLESDHRIYQYNYMHYINNSLKTLRSYSVFKQLIYELGLFRKIFYREDILDLWNNLDSEENIWFVSSLESIQKKLDKKEIDYEFLVYPNISNISQENPEYRMWKMYSQYLQNKKKINIHEPTDYFISNKLKRNMNWSISDAHPSCNANVMFANYFLSKFID